MRTIDWVDGEIHLIDQTRLPDELVVLGSGTNRRVVRLGVLARKAVVAAAGTQRDGPLLVARGGQPLTERAVHEQLLTIGSLAGLGHWVTARHTRRTFIAITAHRYPLPVALRMSGHGSRRYPPAPAEVALAAQMRRDWMSPLELLLGGAPQQQAA